MKLFALLKIHFLKPLKGENLAVWKINKFDFDLNFVILTMFPFNRYNIFPTKHLFQLVETFIFFVVQNRPSVCKIELINTSFIFG